MERRLAVGVSAVEVGSADGHVAVLGRVCETGAGGG